MKIILSLRTAKLWPQLQQRLQGFNSYWKYECSFSLVSCLNLDYGLKLKGTALSSVCLSNLKKASVHFFMILSEVPGASHNCKENRRSTWHFWIAFQRMSLLKSFQAPESSSTGTEQLTKTLTCSSLFCFRSWIPSSSLLLRISWGLRALFL